MARLMDGLVEPLAESALMMIEWRRRVAPAIVTVQRDGIDYLNETIVP